VIGTVENDNTIPEESTSAHLTDADPTSTDKYIVGSLRVLAQGMFFLKVKGHWGQGEDAGSRTTPRPGD
jgi:hypothetical protein